MNVERREILSSSDPADSHPWYELEVDEETGVIRIVDDSDGGSATDVTAAEEGISDGSAEVPNDDRIWAVTIDGEFVSYAPDDTDVPSLRAHLAWYHSATETLEILEFVEP